MINESDTLSRRSVLKRGIAVSGALVVGSSMATGSVAAGIGDGRVAHYHLNNLNYDRDRGEIVAGHVHDASPEHNHGIWYDLETDPVVNDGAVGNAFEFEESFVQIEEDESLELTSAVTIAAWVWRDGTKNLAYIYDGQGHNYLIKMKDGTERPEFYVRIEGNWQVLTAAEALPDQTWTHVAGTYDSTEETQHLYIDGALDKSANVSGQLDTGLTGTNISTSRIGDTVWELSDEEESGGYRFNGRLDEVRVYNRALSESEVVELYEMADL